MKKPRFHEGVLVAVVISLVAGTLFTMMSAFFPTRWLLSVMVSGVSLAYIVYLLIRSKEKTGRVALLSIWIAFAFILWLVSPSVLILMFIHVGVIWLVRALYYHNSVLIALMDLGLVAIGIMASVWTLLHTHSLLLAVWVFFLLQALFVMLPDSVRPVSRKQAAHSRQDGFEQAYSAAQSAVRQLSSQQS